MSQNRLFETYLTAIDEELRTVINSAPSAPFFDVMLSYPFGWVDELGNPYHMPAGKRIRPLLVLLSAATVGGDWEKALPAAAGIEILHNFSLVHDDIEDQSETRHNRPTAWKIWGNANAINLGDALFVMAYRALTRLQPLGLKPETILRVYEVFTENNLELTRGQHLDMRFETQPIISTEDYVSMVKGKTAALVASCTEIGALIGSEDPQRARHFAEFGLNLGIAFQIRDDILGIWGDPEKTGKSAAIDIISRKKSLPVLYGLEQNSDLKALYLQPEFSDADVTRTVQLLNAVNAQEHAVELETRYHQQAMQALENANPSGAEAEVLLRLTNSLLQREA